MKKNKTIKEEKEPILISARANFAMWFLSALVFNFLLELIQRLSLKEALVHLFMSPMVFFINTLIVMFTSVFMMFVGRKFFAFSVTAGIWLFVVVTYDVCLTFRPQPLFAKDFLSIKEALDMTKLYMEPWQLVLIAVSIIALITGLVILFKKGPKFKVEKKENRDIGIPALVCVLTFALMVSWGGVLNQKDMLANELYANNGFAYTFYNSIGVFDGFKRLAYSDEKAQEIIAGLEKGNDVVPDDLPNIVVLQLESFFDVGWFKDVVFTEDPTDYFRKLCDGYPSGYLGVPSNGGGTANVEFEVLTAMALYADDECFDRGESPYLTFLNDTVLRDAQPFVLKDVGYKAHAIHNHIATFYGRNVAYANIGFDTFTSLEYMNGVSHNSETWAKDDILPGEIMTALESTDERDFVFTVSVQAHGPYPISVRTDEFDPLIRGNNGVLSEEDQNKLAYYASSVNEDDRMLEDLIERLENFDEKTVLVIYGDHLPVLNFEAAHITAPDYYTSQYVIWSNYGLEGEDRDLETYQLMSYVQSLIGIDEGVLVRYHQQNYDKETYQDGLVELIKNSKYEAIKQQNLPSDLKYSIHPVKVTNIMENGSQIIVNGENMTKYTKVMVNDQIMPTIFLSPECIYIDGYIKNVGDSVKIVQTSKNNEILEYVK